MPPGTATWIYSRCLDSPGRSGLTRGISGPNPSAIWSADCLACHRVGWHRRPLRTAAPAIGKLRKLILQRMPAGFDSGHVLDELPNLARERVIAAAPERCSSAAYRDIAAGSRPDVTYLFVPRMFGSPAAPHLRKHLLPGEPIDIGRDLSLAQGQHRPAIGLSNSSPGSSRCRLRRDPAKPKLSGKPFAPGLKVCLAWV